MRVETKVRGIPMYETSEMVMLDEIEGNTGEIDCVVSDLKPGGFFLP
jgi:hypothetical protein